MDNSQFDSERGDQFPPEHSLEEIVLEELMCAVCFDYASPPILTCENSHVCCETCNSKVLHCPQCRYQEIVCPLKRKLRCRWHSNMKSLPQHLKEDHEEHVIFEGMSCQKVAKYGTLKGNHGFALLFCVEGKVFMLCFSSFQSHIGIVRVNMYEIANCVEGPATKYKFDLKFSSDLEAPEDKTNYVNLSAGIALSTVDQLQGDANVAANNFVRGNYFTLCHRWLLDACDKDGDLRYQVSISKVEKPSENDFYCKLRKRVGEEECEELDWDLAAAF